MNEDLGTEYRSIVQYNQHIATLKGLEVQSVLAELRQHLTQELNHAVVLAEQIDFLGAVPTVEVPAVPSATETRAASSSTWNWRSSNSSATASGPSRRRSFHCLTWPRPCAGYWRKPRSTCATCAQRWGTEAGPDHASAPPGMPPTAPSCHAGCRQFPARARPPHTG